MEAHRKSPRVEILASTLVTGGAERVIEALALGLPRHGCAVRVLCLHEPGEVGEAIARSGVPVVSRIARVRFDAFAFIRLASALRGSSDGVLLSLDHHDALCVGAIASRCAGMKHRLAAIHSTGLWGKASSFSRSDRLVLRAYERIVALANAHADYLVEREGIERSKVRIIPNGVDTERFRPARNEEERARVRRTLSIPLERFVVAVVAALRPEKNHALLLEAASRIAKSRGEFLFLIVGEGTEGPRLQRMARERSLGGCVRFMGRRSDVSDILAASDASVLCSYPVVETFPLVLLEAMACGVAVVATDVGAVREMLVSGEEGIIVPPGDADALATALVSLAGQSEMRRRIGSRARDRVVRDFTVETMVKRYAALIAEVGGA
jgi:glycosyltransferase involved in cell wall biosynthesis